MGAKKEVRENEYLFIDKDLMTRILHMYVEGVPVEDISAWTGLSGKDVSRVIDSISYAL